MVYCIWTKTENVSMAEKLLVTKPDFAITSISLQAVTFIKYKHWARKTQAKFIYYFKYTKRQKMIIQVQIVGSTYK